MKTIYIPPLRHLAMAVCLILSVLRLSAATETATRSYNINDISYSRLTASDNNEYIRVNWKGLSTTADPGEPELPVEYIRFLIPVYAKVTGVKVNNNISHAETIDSRIYPVQQPVPISHVGEVEFTAPDKEAYNRNYNIRAEYVDDGFIDGCNHIVTVAVYPMAYNAANGTISRTSEVTVTLEYESCQASELGSTPIFPPSRSRYLNLEDMVVNPAKVSDRNYAPRKKAAESAPEYYYIITPRNLEKAFEDLAAWKRQKGYNVLVKCIEDVYADPRYRIGATYSLKGSGKTEQVLDSAMSLRCYLKDQFVLNGHYFCLLAGDWRTPTPIRKYASSQDCSDNSEYVVPTDLYFSNLTNDYILRKLTKGSIYVVSHPSYKDSISYSYSIAVGRLLCATSKEVSNYISKLILYEGNPGYGSNEYLTSALFFEECSYYWTKLTDKETGEVINTIVEGNCLINDSESVREKCSFFKNIVLFQDKFHLQLNDRVPLQDNCMNSMYDDGPSAPEVLEGLSQVGFSCWHGHGMPYGVACGSNGHVIYADDEHIGKAPYTDIKYKNLPHSGLNNLKNQSRPSIVYSVSCSNAPFDKLTIEGIIYSGINLGRAFTTENAVGGPAALMHTRPAYTTHANNIEVGFVENIHTTRKVGECLRTSILCSPSPRRSDNYSINLIGEPEFEMWLDKPQTFDVSLKPANNGVTVDGVLPESTMYIISDGKTSFTKDDVSGTTFTNPYTDEFCFSVWKTGYLPIVSLFAQKGTLSESKRYVVRDAILGNVTDSQSSYTIANNGVLSVRAIDNISTYSGFSIESGGSAVLECDRTVNLNGGIIRKGGKLIIKAKDVKLGSGFKVEAGGILEINKL